MNIECIVKAGGIAPKDFKLNLDRLGAIIDLLAAYEASLSRPNWRMKGYSLREAQSSEVYTDDGSPSQRAVEELQAEHPDEGASSIGIWDGSVREDVGASIDVLACGGIFPDTVSIDVSGVFVDKNKDLVVALVARAAMEFTPAVISAAPHGYAEKQAFDDRPGVGWMLYLPVELDARQVPEAHEFIPVLSADRKKRLGTIVVSIGDEPFSTDNEAHLAIAHGIEARLVSMDLLPLFTDI